MSKQQIVNAPFLYINNLSVAWASNTTLTLASGICRDSTNTFDISLTANKTINAAVNGANGLDTGSFAASKCYAVFVVADSSGFNSPVGLISLSATAPVLPTGYDIFRRVGWAFSDGSTHFILVYQSGNGSSRKYVYDEPVSALAAGTSATFAAVSLVQKIPAIEGTPVKLQIDFTPNAADDASYIRAGGSSATNGIVTYGNVAAKKASAQVEVLTKLVSSEPKFEYKVTASGSLNALLVSFIDYI